MDTVIVKRDELLERLRENRDSHRSIFDKALEVYRERVEAWLLQRLDDLRARRKIRIHYDAPEPVDYTHVYDAAILMLEMHIKDEVEITSRDFRRYVMNEWEWREHFAANTAAYLVTEPGD